MNTLPEKLKSLPEFTPPPGGWAQLTRRMDARRQVRRARYTGVALAASLLLTLSILPRFMASGEPGVIPALEGAVENQDTPQLMQRSRELEQTLTQLRPRVVAWNQGLAAQAASLENDLSVVDLQLNYADRGAARQLWQNRVDLMSRLVQTHQQAAVLPASFDTSQEISL